MPDSHNENPDYEATFSKVATILEQLTVTQERLADAVAQLATKVSEHEDKLNAVIDLLDRHIREHDRKD